MDFKDISKKRQKKWKGTDLYKVKEDTNKPKFYILDMFPYPSGAALHVGHPKGYIATDCLARKKMLEGFNVLHPMGFDTFGLGTEQYAIDHKMKPQLVSEQNIKTFVQQLENFGTTYDWSRSVNTADPKYFKRTQRIFLQLYDHYYDEKLKKAMPIASLKLKVESGKLKVNEPIEEYLNNKRLAYVDFKPINWCPKCMTGLANEDLDGGKCERCGSEVEQKPMKQWVLRITKYAERLLEGLENLKRDESMKDLERNWIGKSVGTEFKMKIVTDNHPTLNPSPLHGEGTRLPRVYTVGKNKLPSGDTMIALARELRKKQTVAEGLLRELLRNKQIKNLKFRRQHPIGNYIADFYCPEKNLVIELDGSIHGIEDQKKRDQERDAVMKGHNLNVIRFSNDDIFEKIEEVIQTIIDISNTSPLATEWRGAGGEVTLELGVYTTRIDTVFGMSFIAIAPEHPLVESITTTEHKTEVEKYKEAANKKSQLERTELQKEKTGVFCGAYAINPFNDQKVPIFVADYVLANYGTGVVMAVPAHDERDFEFAKKHSLPISQSIMPDSFDLKNPPRKDKKNTERNTVHVILRNPKEKTVLVQFLKGEKWGALAPKNFIIGGIEEGESELEAATREVQEETGYTQIKFIEKVPLEIQANFFAAHKDVNRKIRVHTLVFDLLSDARVEIIEDEHFTKDSHEHHRIPYDKVAETINIVDDEMSWKYFYTGGFAYTDKGILINSGEFTGLTSDEAITKMQARLTSKGIGGIKVNYKMQDRVFSRQRYWGEPFPVLRTTKDPLEKGGNEGGFVAKAIPLTDKDLPLELPDVENYAPTGTVEGPLANITDRVNVILPDGTQAKRETNTMPGRAGSSRYWLRYMDPSNDKALVAKDKEKYRGSVDVYVGGAEHITRHMIYGRFWQKFLYDIGTVSHEEPFQEYHSVGLIMGEDGRKMSKRRGNVVNPDDIIDEFGTDVLRTYEMFMGPFDQSIARNTSGIKGIKKFLDKIILLKDNFVSLEKGRGSEAEEGFEEAKQTKILLHQTIKKVGEDIDAFRFNTAVSHLMILVNHLTDCKNISKKTFEDLVILISPFAPHIAEELREQMGNEYSLFTKASWPKYDEKHLVADTVTIAVQINGKVRGTLSIGQEAEENEVIQLAKADAKIAARIISEPKKIIYVKGKILNIVL